MLHTFLLLLAPLMFEFSFSQALTANQLGFNPFSGSQYEFLPEGIPQLSIRGLRVGDTSVDLFFERHADTVRVQVLEKQGEVEVVATL